MDKNDRLIHSRRKRILFPFFNNENRPTHKQMNRLDILINNLTNENTIKKSEPERGFCFSVPAKQCAGNFIYLPTVCPCCDRTGKYRFQPENAIERDKSKTGIQTIRQVSGGDTKREERTAFGPPGRQT